MSAIMEKELNRNEGKKDTPPWGNLPQLLAVVFCKTKLVMIFHDFFSLVCLFASDVSELNSARIQLGSAREIFEPARLANFG